MKTSIVTAGLIALAFAGCTKSGSDAAVAPFTCPSIDIDADGTWIHGQAQSDGSEAEGAFIEIIPPNGTTIKRQADRWGCFLERGDPGRWSGSVTHPRGEGHFSFDVVEGDLHTFTVEIS